MKIKIISACLVLAACHLVEQTSLYMKSETSMPLMVFLGQKITIITYVKGNKFKSEVNTAQSNQIQCYTEDKCAIISKEKGSSIICGEGTVSEMKEFIKTKDNIEYSDMKVEKTNKTITVLGYECQNAKITYKISVMGMKIKNETSVWYTNKIKLQNDFSTGDPNLIGYSNAYTDALKSIGGVILKQESKTSGLLVATITITEIDQKEIDDSEFIPDAKDCTKMLSIKEASDEIDKRNARRQQQESMMNQQMRTH